LRRLQRVSCPLGALRESIPFERFGRNDFFTPIRHIERSYISALRLAGNPEVTSSPIGLVPTNALVSVLNGVVPELSASRKLPSDLSGNVGHDGECHDTRQAANLLKGLVGARGFEPRTSCAQGSCKKSILLVRLALFCVMVHGFGPNLAAFGPKLDPSDRIWLRDSRKFLEGKRLWLRRPDTYRTYNCCP
jgi:hypothetical protein